MFGLSPAELTAIAAGLQAITAVFIGVLTWRLVTATSDYVDETGHMVEEMRRTNDMARANTERSVLLGSPSLEVGDGGQGHDEQADVWASNFRVRNHGSSVAYDVTVQTESGDTSATEPIAADAEWKNIECVQSGSRNRHRMVELAGSQRGPQRSRVRRSPRGTSLPTRRPSRPPASRPTSSR